MLTVHIWEPNWRTRCCTQWILRVSLVGNSSNLWTWTRGCLITWWQLDSKQSFLKGPILDLPRHQLFVAVFLTFFHFTVYPNLAGLNCEGPPSSNHYRNSHMGCVDSVVNASNPVVHSLRISTIIPNATQDIVARWFLIPQRLPCASHSARASWPKKPPAPVMATRPRPRNVQMSVGGARRSNSVYNTIKWSNLLFPHFVSFFSQWHVHD
jgi:hypothetical protein